MYHSILVLTEDILQRKFSKGLNVSAGNTEISRDTLCGQVKQCQDVVTHEMKH